MAEKSNLNKEYEDYVVKYAKCYNLTIEEAKSHEITNLYLQYLIKREKEGE